MIKVVYVIFSDIHGNVKALRQLLEREGSDIENCYIFCGDICGYYYKVDECVKVLKNISGLIAVRGNHDQYYIESYLDEKKTSYLANKYGASYKRKTDYVYSFIQDLPLKNTIYCEQKKIHIQHGSPIDPLEGRIYPDTVLPDVEDEAIYITGHTHYSMYRKSKDGIWINPGSLGQPRDGKGFSYCKLDMENMNVTFHTLEIDISDLIQEIRNNDTDNKYLEEVLYRT